MNELLLVLVVFLAISCAAFLMFYFIRMMICLAKKCECNTGKLKLYEALLRLDNVIHSSVVATNQTLVAQLKKSDSFYQIDKEEAFYQTLSSINSIVKKEDLALITPVIGNMNEWINSRIEYYVKQEKQDSK